MRPENLGQSASPWMATTAAPSRNALVEDTRADVCIVGAGIAGITTAYLLAKQGKSVVVLDDGAVGGGQTQRTTAHLSNAIDAHYFEIERLHGPEGARLAASSHTVAIDRIESIMGEEHIDCDFVRLDGYLFLPPGASAELLDHELAAAHRAGLAGVERLPRAPLLHFDTGPCLRFPRQGQMHPLGYLTGVTNATERAGGRIFTAAHAETIKGGAPARIKTSNGWTVTADAVVVATNSPVNDLVAIHTKQAAYMTYAIGAIIPHGLVETALYWDTFDPYHYVRIQPSSPEAGTTEQSGYEREDVLIVGGEDHKTGQAPARGDPYARLEAWTRERFPMIRDVRFRWSGQVMETIDGLAYIGRNPLDHPNVFIVTGDSGMGMTYGTIAGILLTDLILGRPNPWTALYDPSRKTVHALDRFAKESLNVAWQYGDWLTRGDVDSPAKISSGTGAVLRRGLTKVAIYRDEQGVCHERSAVCTHLGGIIHWNDAEKTWDCPCHGSRFDRLGGVLHGPANRDLSSEGGDCKKGLRESPPAPGEEQITQNSAPSDCTAANPVVEPNTQTFLDGLAAKGGPQIYELSVEDARGVLSEAQSRNVEKVPADIEDRLIPVGPKGQIAIRIVRPKGSADELPVVMYFHGGGWVLGDAETHDRLIREIANGAHAAVVFVNYSRPPEARYPVAIEEAYAATKWVSENAKALNVDGSRLAVVGDSVGGNMAAALTLLAKQRGGPPIHLQVLFYPVTDADFDTPSYRQFAEGYFLTREAMKWFWNHYAPDVAIRAQATASPLRATIEQLRGLPPALVITGECDVLRDEGEAYACKLIQAGVRVTALRYMGTIHDFVMLNAITDTPAARSAITQTNDMLHEVFIK